MSIDDERPARRRSHKDRRRWCRGRRGVEHQAVCMTFAQAKGKPTTEGEERSRFLVCTACGKELEHYIPWPWGELRKPAWVTC